MRLKYSGTAFAGSVAKHASAPTYTEAHEKPLREMTVSMEKAVMMLKLLVEGSSVRSIERITDVHRDTIMSLLILAGEKCEKIIAKHVRNVPVQDVECDEIWAFVQKKEGHKKDGTRSQR